MRPLRFLLSLAAALPLLFGPGVPRAQAGMAQDALDSLTHGPGQRSGGQSGSQSGGRGSAPAGPTAPTPPSVPATPGASAPAVAPLPGGSASTAAGRRSTAAQGQSWLSLRHDGAERRALLEFPSGKKVQAGRRPTLILLHGAGGSATQVARQTGLPGRAAAAGYLVVIPEGLGQSWNAWNCCGPARDQRVDDTGFLSELINRLRTDYAADPRRVFMAGFSNGAMLASRFALERPGAVTALAAVGGYLPCDAPRPAEGLPVLLINGERDAIARFGPNRAHPATGRACEDAPARAQADFWVRGLGLASGARVRESARPPLRVEDYGPERGGRGELRLVIVRGGGHAWPGGAAERYPYCDLPRADVDATGMVLAFFRSHDPGAAGEPAQAVPARKAGAAKKR